MTSFRRSGAQITFFVLSIIGVAISVYLTVAHYEKAPVVCSNTGLIDCQRVLSSIYSFVPYTHIPISLPGLGWFVVSTVVAFLAWRIWPERRDLKIAQVVLFGSGVLTALYLVFVELTDLHTICAWCTSLHIIMLVMLLIAVFQLLQSDPGYEEVEDEDEGDEVASPQMTIPRT
jgi:uncharacterized membrane protein